MDNKKFVEIYREEFGSEWANGLSKLPQHMVPGLVRYILWGIRPGDFMASMLSGDLFGCLRKADDVNKHSLHAYAIFLYSHAPTDCFENVHNVSDWINQKGALKTSPPKDIW